MRIVINDREKLEFALQPSEIALSSQAAWWLSEIASGRLKSRKKNKRGQRIRVSTLEAYTTAVVYLNEKIGDRTLATFDNAEMKELISTMEAETKKNGEQRFTPKTIVNYYLIAAAVFATAKDRKGKQLFPRQCDLNYIGLPAVDKEIHRQSHEWLSVRDFRRLAYVTAKHCERQLASDSQKDGTRVGRLSHISPIP